MPSTLSDALNPVTCRICAVLNLAGGDPRVTGFINSAQQRLLTRGHWWGTCPRYTVSVTNGLFTLPPQFATMELAAVSRCPVNLRNQWYEFNSNGWGIVNNPTSGEVCNSSQAIFRGQACTFLDIPSPTQLTIQCDVSADSGVQVLLLGYDSSGNWIRTNGTNGWYDGELVSLSQIPGISTVHTFASLTGIQLSGPLNGQWWLYAGTVVSGTLIGNYQYWETRPLYSRYLLPNISTTATQLDFVGKLGFRPAVNPSDYLIIGNLEALKLACLAIRREEEGKFDEAQVYMNGQRDNQSGRVVREGAITILDDELNHYQGVGTVITPRIMNQGLPPIPALI